MPAALSENALSTMLLSEESYLDLLQNVFAQKNWQAAVAFALSKYISGRCSALELAFPTVREAAETMGYYRKKKGVAESSPLPIAVKIHLKRLYRLGLANEVLDSSVAVIFSTAFFFYSSSEYFTNDEKARLFFQSFLLSTEEFVKATKETSFFQQRLQARSTGLEKQSQPGQIVLRHLQKFATVSHFRLPFLRWAAVHCEELSREDLELCLSDPAVLTRGMASEGYLVECLRKSHSLAEVLLFMEAAPRLSMKEWDRYLDNESLRGMPLEWWLPLVRASEDSEK